MSLKYFHKYNVYSGNQIARTSVWMTLWPIVGSKPGNSYNWNCAFIFLPRSLIFSFALQSNLFLKATAVNFCFPKPSWAKIPALPVFYQEVMEGRKAGKEPRGDKRELKTTLPRISGSLSNWYAYWQASDLSLFWLHRQFLFCTQSCVKTRGIEHGTQKTPASST